MDAIDLTQSYLILEPDHGVERVDLFDGFWEDLASGAPESEGAQRVARTDGRMVGRYPMTESWPVWERHPAGDEVLFLVSGHMVLHVEFEDGVRTLDLRAGQTCVVPTGLWHTADVLEPGDLVGMTAGKGTEHRPR